MFERWKPASRAVVNWIKDAVSRPREELDRWERALRFCYDLGRFGWRQLRQDKAPQMAAALAYRTLFGLLPVLVVSTVMIKAFRGVEAFQEMVREIMREIGLYEIILPTGATDPSDPDLQTLGHWLEGLISQASTINLAAIGWVGVAVLVYAAVSLMVTIENSFNEIYRAPEGRQWLRRIPVYFTVLLGWPIAMGLISYFDDQFKSTLEAANVWQFVSAIAPTLWTFVATWLIITLLYGLVPNTSVEIRPVLVGGFIAAVLTEVGRYALSAYFENAISFNQIYGSLGSIPIFMFWVYLMWLVVLFGLEVSVALQKLKGRRIEEMQQQQRQQPARLVDPVAVLTVMEIIAEKFDQGQPVSISHLEAETSIGERSLYIMIERLQQEKFVHVLDHPGNTVTLARPAAMIGADALIRVGFELADASEPNRQSRLVDRLRDAQQTLARQVTLASLSREASEPRPSDQAL